ncbi:hypothetical protein [Microbulbifer epialgicus]|uniref:Uncharacterized protein n=1 Tax=Microbulbifer epialgicus TaxID=393907 RepID=A0ABV4NVM8_9GAMM
MLAIKNRQLYCEQIQTLFKQRSPADLDWYQTQIAGGEQALGRQDRLLEMIRFFTLVDKKAGKIVARYQQVFGIKRLLERIAQRGNNGVREGGLIWHTTG